MTLEVFPFLRHPIPGLEIILAKSRVARSGGIVADYVFRSYWRLNVYQVYQDLICLRCEARRSRGYGTFYIVLHVDSSQFVLVANCSSH